MCKNNSQFEIKIIAEELGVKNIKKKSIEDLCAEIATKLGIAKKTGMLFKDIKTS